MMKGQIIQLNAEKEYYVLEDLEYNHKKYIFASCYDQNTESFDDTNFIILEVKYDNEQWKVYDITDEAEVNIVTTMFLNKMKEHSK